MNGMYDIRPSNCIYLTLLQYTNNVNITVKNNKINNTDNNIAEVKFQVPTVANIMTTGLYLVDSETSITTRYACGLVDRSLRNIGSSLSHTICMSSWFSR